MFSKGRPPAPPGTLSNVEVPNRATAVDPTGPSVNSAPNVEGLDRDHASGYRARRSRSSRSLGDPGRELDSLDVRLGEANLGDRIDLEDLENLHRGRSHSSARFHAQGVWPTKICLMLNEGIGR